MHVRSLAIARIVAISTVFLAVGCSDDPDSSSGTGTDAGAVPDTGSATDTGAGSDTGSVSDTGSTAGSDAGSAAGSDAGSAVDTGSGPDPTLCTATGTKGAAFDSSATGSEPFQTVGDFTVSTLDGPLTFSKIWTGCDSHVFVINHPDPKYAGYAGAIWKTNPNTVFKQAPKQTHWYFLSYSNGAQAQNEVTAQRTKWLNALTKLPIADQDHWKPRLHFITANAWQVPGWIGNTLKKKGVFHFAVDPQQRRREIGLARMPIGNQPGHLRHLVFETQRYEWELKNRHVIEKLPGKKTVTILDKTPVHSGWGYKKHFVDVTMPTAKELEAYDSAFLELGHGCKGGLDANCPAWDRETSLWVCDVAKDPGEPPPVACAATETTACTCTGADGKERKAKRKCKKDKSGFGACNCACTEFARQISTYKRHGWWLTDVSPLLPLIKAGGKQKWAYTTVDKWITTAKLHLFKGGKTTRPDSIRYLWNGGQYHDKYNAAHKPITVDVPKDAKKARIVAMISGHGSGTDTHNCAEFCPHSHHFTVGKKGDGPASAGKEYVRNHVMVNEGCLKKVPQGVVPNQFGTWPFPRAGWCPGWDVKLWTADVTDSLKPGAKVQIAYKSLLFGKNYTPKWTGKGDYKPVIKMRSWIVFEK